MSSTVIQHQTTCPGCRLRMPSSPRAAYDGYINCTAECWGVYSEVLGREYSNPILFGHVHQLTVDAYAVQHAGGAHPDKSVAIHLAGLYAAFVQGSPHSQITRLRQNLANRVVHWPHFSRPEQTVPLTVFAVALAESVDEHVNRVERWARMVWDSWEVHHGEIAEFVEANKR